MHSEMGTDKHRCGAGAHNEPEQRHWGGKNEEVFRGLRIQLYTHIPLSPQNLMYIKRKQK